MNQMKIATNQCMMRASFNPLKMATGARLKRGVHPEFLKKQAALYANFFMLE